MRVFRRLLSLLAPFRWRVALAVLLGALTIASNIGLLGMAAYLIAASALKPLLVLLTLPIYIVRLSGVARAASRYAERLVGHSVTFRLLERLRTRTYRRVASLAPELASGHRSGDLLARIVADVDELQHVYLRVVGPFLVAGLVAALTSGLFALFSPTLAWTALAFLVVAGVAIPLLAERLSRGFGERLPGARANLNESLIDGIQGVQDVLAFGMEDEFRERIAAADGALARTQRRMATISALEQSLRDFATSLAVWTILLLTIPLVESQRIGGIYVAFLALIILASFEAIQPLPAALQFAGRTRAAGERVFSVVDIAPQVTDPVEPLPAPSSSDTRSRLDQTLTFDHVSFAYEPEGRRVLNDVSFSVPAGNRVAIVGASGAGKSTILRLAVRFSDPTSGNVLLNGVDIRHYALRDLRASVGVLTQDSYVFNRSVRANLLLARPEADDSDLWLALEQAQLADHIRQLPQGLDTLVGEQGQRLAGGERQRLAIARLLLQNAPLLILDEPTANLDTETEAALLDTLDIVTRGRATLLITHRLRHMERMDQILVLDHGQIAERGAHTELCETDGPYRRMLDIQNSMLDLEPAG
jgi:ATP-binding cassette subfamily C protein CydC